MIRSAVLLSLALVTIAAGSAADTSPPPLATTAFNPTTFVVGSDTITGCQNFNTLVKSTDGFDGFTFTCGVSSNIAAEMKKTTSPVTAIVAFVKASETLTMSKFLFARSTANADGSLAVTVQYASVTQTLSKGK